MKSRTISMRFVTLALGCVLVLASVHFAFRPEIPTEVARISNDVAPQKTSDLQARAEDPSPARIQKERVPPEQSDGTYQRPASPGGIALGTARSLNDPFSAPPEQEIAGFNLVETITDAALPALTLILLLTCFVQTREASLQDRATARWRQRATILSQTDAATGLLNWHGFQEATAQVWADEEARLNSGIVILKLTGLKRVNDQFGLRFGDQVLQSVAHELSAYLTRLDPENRVARLANADFACLIRQANDIELKCLVPILEAVVSVPVRTDQLYVTLKVQAGSAHGSRTKAPEEALLCALQTDASLATEASCDVLALPAAFPQTGINGTNSRDDLSGALLKNEFFPVYQPQIDMRSGEMLGVEALARWRHPEIGMIPPDEFIETAEECGLISELGRFMLQTACEDAVTLRGNSTVSVNLSALQIFQDDIKDHTLRALNETGLEAKRLKLEVTESILIKDKKRVYETLYKLKKIGVAVSLDDFGTGYSGLSYLSEFEWDELKIDRSFVEQALDCARARSVAETVGTLANNMDARLTVEGIETARQRDLFASLGYQTGQGFFYSRPLKFADLNASPYVLTSRKEAAPTRHS